VILDIDDYLSRFLEQMLLNTDKRGRQQTCDEHQNDAADHRKRSASAKAQRHLGHQHVLYRSPPSGQAMFVSVDLSGGAGIMVCRSTRICSAVSTFEDHTMNRQE